VLVDHVRHHYLGDAAPVSHPAAVALVVVAQQMAGEGYWDLAIARYRRSVEIAPGTRGPNLGLAWLLSTCPVDSLRNGEEAVEVLAALGDRYQADPQFLDVQGAVLAENGQFESAVATVRRAIFQFEAAGRVDESFLDTVRQRLDLYQRGVPFRVEALAAAQSSGQASGPGQP
ncbi:MAG: hypothetical protein ABIF77_09900, partial [bacterium]